MEQTKITLINNIVKLSDALQILLCIGIDGKNSPDFIENENKAYNIMKQQYGAFSLCFEEIKHTIDAESLYRVLGDFMNSEVYGRSSLFVLCLQWFNVYGYNGYIDSSNKPEWMEIIEQSQNLSQEPQQIPKELETTEAKKVLTRGITEGLLDNNYQPAKGVTRAQQKEFADLASRVLNIQNKWVVFGSLWNIKNLGQVKTTDAAPEKLKRVRKLFPELGFNENGVERKLQKEKFR